MGVEEPLVTACVKKVELLSGSHPQTWYRWHRQVTLLVRLPAVVVEPVVAIAIWVGVDAAVEPDAGEEGQCAGTDEERRNS